MKSLKLRLSLGLSISMLMVFSVLWFVISASIRTSMEDYVLTRLEHDAESLLGGLNAGPDGDLILDDKRIQGIYRQPFSGHYYVIKTPDKIFRSRSLWDNDLQFPEAEKTTTNILHITGPQQQALLVLVKDYRSNKQEIKIAVAEDISHLQQAIHDFRLWLSLVSGLALLGLIILQWANLSRSLKPVNDIQQDIRQLESGEVETLNENIPDEMLPLVEEINRLLKSQQQRLKRSRDALGNLAHSIKTPLALLQHIFSESKQRIDAETQQQLQRNIDRIAKLVEVELKRARVAGRSIGRGQFDFKTHLADLVATLQSLYKDKNIEFTSQGNLRLSLPLEQEDGMELFGNLLDNAWKWAKSRVTMTLSNNEQLLIRVEDNGPGCDENLLKQLSQRGARFDETTQGHGLGLSIVQAIVDSIDGSLRFKKSDALGGLCVEITLRSSM